MKDITIIDGGIYDSTVNKKNINRSPTRIYNCFIIEYYISSAGGSLVSGNSKYDFLPNTLTITKPGDARYSFFHYKCFYLHLKIPDDHDFYKILLNSPTFISFVDTNLFIDIFKTLTLHFVEYGITNDLFVIGKLSELCFALQSLNKIPIKNCNYVDSENFHTIMQIKEFLETHYEQKTTLSLLSKKFNYSVYYLQRSFKHIIGESPQDYLNDCRIKASKEMLLLTQKSILDIALDCGFSSQSHFSTVFKKTTGMTPLKFRKVNTSSTFSYIQ